MKNLPLTVLLAAVLAGCIPPTQSNKASGGVAVVDLEAVAKRLGRDVSIAEELKSSGNSLGLQLTSVQKELQAAFEKKKQEIGSSPTQTELQGLEELERNLNVQFQQKQQEAQQELNAKRNALVVRFREEVKPIAMRIAQGRGCSTVLVKNDNVILDSSNAYEITDEVIGEMVRMHGGSSAAAAAEPAPRAEAPASTSGTTN